MKILIIEDERLTARNLKAMIRELVPGTDIVGMPESVHEAIAWFGMHPMPDVVFMDIHLSDGSSFSIFDQLDITCPIIFTTAYDEYALRAFEVNSVDYLLKPISPELLKRALDKLERLRGSDNVELVKKVADTILKGGSAYKSSLLVPVKDKFIPVKVKDIAYIYFEERKTVAVGLDGSRHTMNTLLDDIMSRLDPAQFYRANRQFIVSRAAVKDITIWFGSRIVVNLCVDTPERIIVSRTNAQDFKAWLTE